MQKRLSFPPSRPRRARYRSLPVASLSPPPGTGPELTAPEQLTVSISRYGLMNPLTVRKRPGGYQVICGALRLQALRQCGIKRARCVIVDADDAACLALRLEENSARGNWDFLKTADTMRALIHDHGYTLERVAASAGMTCERAVDLLRALALPRPLLCALRETGLTESHALNLLRLPDGPEREGAFFEMASRHMSPNEAERYVERILEAESGDQPACVVRDVRLFLNSVNRALDVMRLGGVPAECLREDADNCIKLTIRIPERERDRVI